MLSPASGAIPRLVHVSVVQVSELIIPTVETARQSFFLKTYLDHEIPMLFVGPTGTGKSAITNNFLLHLPKNIYVPNCLNFSARTSAYQTQDIIMSKLDRRRKGLYGPPIGKKAVVFVGKAQAWTPPGSSPLGCQSTRQSFSLTDKIFPINNM